MHSGTRATRRHGLPGATQAIIATALLMSAAVATAQVPSVDVAPSERAKRDAENPMRWILLHSDKPRKSRETPPPVPAAPAALRKPVVAAAPASRPAAGSAAAAAETEAVAATPAPESKVIAEPAGRTLSAAAASTLPKALPDPAPPPAAADDPDDEPLIALEQSPPAFPRAVMNDLRRGAVQVQFTVQPDGTVVNGKVLKSSSSRLNGTALATVSRWKFKPRLEAADVAIELAFNLD